MLEADVRDPDRENRRRMHLAKAKNAAASGDKEALENELEEATAIGPRNPALAKQRGSPIGSSLHLPS